MAADRSNITNRNFAWDKLPYQLLKDIFQYLGHESIYTSIVCKHWRSVAYTNNVFWKYLHIGPDCFPDLDTLNSSFSPIKVCQHLILDFNPLEESHVAASEAILGLLKYNDYLHSLSVRPVVVSQDLNCDAIRSNDFLSKRILNSVLDVVSHCHSIKHFDWGGGFGLHKWQNRILRALKIHHKYSLTSLGFIRSQINPFRPISLDLKSFAQFNLNHLSLDYAQLSEQLLMVLCKKSVNLSFLKLFVQNSVHHTPLIRNQTWRHTSRRLPNLKVILYFICVNDLKLNLDNTNFAQSNSTSFINEHTNNYQEQMNQLLSNKILPSDMPLNAIYFYYCKPDPLNYLVQYLTDCFAMSLEHFYLIDTFNIIPVNIKYQAQLIPNTNCDILDFDIINNENLFWLTNEQYKESNQSLCFSSNSSYHSLDTNDLDLSTPDYCSFQYCQQSLDQQLLVSSSTSSASSSSTSTSSSKSYLNDDYMKNSGSLINLNGTTALTDKNKIDLNDKCNIYDKNMSIEFNIKSELNESNRSDLNIHKYVDERNCLIMNETKSIDNYNSFLFVTHPTDPQLSPVFYTPNMYKPVDDVNPDPFVMLAWRCKQLTHFTLLGYWFNIADMKAFTALRGTSLKCFEVPRSCISIDDQPWPICLDEDYSEMSRNLGYKWEPISDQHLPQSIWSDSNIDCANCLNEIVDSNELNYNA